MPIAAAATNALKLKGAKKGGDGLKVKTDVRFARLRPSVHRQTR